MQENNWIKTSERLPEESEDVLGWLEFGSSTDFDRCFYEKGSWYAYRDNEWCSLNCIPTHWVHVEPPKDQ